MHLIVIAFLQDHTKECTFGTMGAIHLNPDGHIIIRQE